MDIAILVFDGLTALDAVGPYEVLWRLPGARLRFVAPQAGMVTTDEGSLALRAQVGLDEVERTDLLLVAGGFGTRRLEHDQRLLEWVRRIDQTTTWTTSVCTGALILAAAGVLAGRRATTHWAVVDRLGSHGAIPVRERTVFDGKYATAAGVSAGVDLALQLAARIAGDPVAQGIQLGIEYDPAPPFALAETPREVHDAVLARIRSREP